MKPTLQLHRSIIFWSGILVMGFICWAWWEASRMTSSVTTENIKIGQNHGGIYVVRNETGYAGPGVRFDRSRPAPLLSGIPWRPFPRPFWVSGEADSKTISNGNWQSYEEWYRDWIAPSPGRVVIVGIPHWLILLGFAGAWGGLLGWRAWWRGKKCRVIGEVAQDPIAAKR